MRSFLRLVHDSSAAPNASPADATAAVLRDRPDISPDQAYMLARLRLAAAERELAKEPTEQAWRKAEEERLAFAEASRLLIRAARR
jgi:hypothetical protein